jgi:hypothetical protein
VRLLHLAALAVLAFAIGPELGLESPATARAPSAAMCGGASYVNSSGHCVRRPVAAPRTPSGASAQCRDGTYSFSEHRRGTCSHHGGVAQWL